MSEVQKTPAVARPSATVMLVRDGAQGIEIFMVKRDRMVDLASGALIFPGGKVDAGEEGFNGLAAAKVGQEGEDRVPAQQHISEIKDDVHKFGPGIFKMASNPSFRRKPESVCN